MGVKSLGLTGRRRSRLLGLRSREGCRIPGVVVECVDIGRNTVAKAAPWLAPDTEARKRGERTGLDTPVVHAVNDVNWVLAV